jgi:hypothetical protein
MTGHELDHCSSIPDRDSSLRPPCPDCFEAHAFSPVDTNGSFSGGKSRWSVQLVAHFCLVPGLKMHESCLNFQIHLHGAVFKHRDNFTAFYNNVIGQGSVSTVERAHEQTPECNIWQLESKNSMRTTVRFSFFGKIVCKCAGISKYVGIHYKSQTTCVNFSPYGWRTWFCCTLKTYRLRKRYLHCVRGSITWSVIIRSSSFLLVWK